MPLAIGPFVDRYQDLSDVNTASLADQDVFKWDSGSSRFVRSAFVSSFNARTGAVTLQSADVTDALGFTPTAGSGTIGALAKFTAGSTLGDSLLNEAGSVVTATGDLRITGTLGLNNTAPSSTASISITRSGTGNYNAINITVTRTDGGTILRGSNVTAQATHASGTLIGLVGYQVAAVLNGAGTVTLAQGYQGTAGTSSSSAGGTITTAEGMRGIVGAVNAGTTTTGIGSLGVVSISGAGATISTGNAVQARVDYTSGTLTTIRGVYIGGWTGNPAATGVDGILIDSTIDYSNASNKFAIRSLSTSPSLLTGNLTVSGVLLAGSGPTTLTDAAGKILSTALNTVEVAQGGTGLTALGSALQVLRVNAGGTALEFAGGGGAAWGAITGTLSDQTDLESALSARALLTGNNSFLGANTFTAAADADVIVSLKGTASQSGNFLSLVSSDGITFASLTGVASKAVLNLYGRTLLDRGVQIDSGGATGTASINLLGGSSALVLPGGISFAGAQTSGLGFLQNTITNGRSGGQASWSCGALVTDTAAIGITITAGSAYSGATINLDGGDISLIPGEPIGIGTAGKVKLGTVGSGTGIQITSNASGSGVTLTAIGGGTHEHIYLTPKGTSGTVVSTQRGSVSLPGMALLNANQGVFFDATNFLGFTHGNVNQIAGLDVSHNWVVASGQKIGWLSTSTTSGTYDTGFDRNAAGAVGINNGTAGQWGSLFCGARNADTGSTVRNGLTLGHQSTGTPAADFNIGIQFNLDSSTTADREAARIAALWDIATDASRTADLVFYTVNGAAALAEAGRFKGAGQFAPAIGMLPDAGGFKHARVTTGSVSAGATALVTITWTTAFADANYTVVAEVLDSTASSLSLSVVHIESKTASAVTVRVLNNALGSLTGTIQAIACHD